MESIVCVNKLFLLCFVVVFCLLGRFKCSLSSPRMSHPCALNLQHIKHSSQTAAWQLVNKNSFNDWILSAAVKSEHSWRWLLNLEKMSASFMMQKVHSPHDHPLLYIVTLFLGCSLVLQYDLGYNTTSWAWHWVTVLHSQWPFSAGFIIK